MNIEDEEFPEQEETEEVKSGVRENRDRFEYDDGSAYEG